METNGMSKYLVVKCDEIENFDHISNMILNGAIIVFPTDTIYGIGCNPFIEKSVEKVYMIKKRDKTKALPILTSTIEDAKKIIELNDMGEKLAKKFWPGALTIVGRIKHNTELPEIITSKMNTLGVRIPNHKCTLNLLKYCKYLIGTSANISNCKSISSSIDIINSNLEGFDILLDGNITTIGFESTVVDISNGMIEVLRIGAIPVDRIYDVNN